MKNSNNKILAYLSVAILLTILPRPSLADNIRPECAEWKKQLEATVKPLHDTEIEYQEGKHFVDLLMVLKAYPAANAYTVRDVEQNLVKQTVDALMTMPGCADIQFYDTVKQFFQSKNMDLKESRQISAVVLDRIVKTDDEAPSLIMLMLDVSLLDLAMHSKVLGVSDLAYFNFIEFRKEVDHYKSVIRLNNRRSSPFDCTNKKSCSESEYGTILDLLVKEYQGNKELQHWLTGWAQRIAQNKQGK